MPRLTCLCGESISISVVPNPQGFKLIWELERERLIEALLAAYADAKSFQHFEEQVYQLFYPANPEFPQIYECPNCGRLAVFVRAADDKPAFWLKQEQKYSEVDSRSALLQKKLATAYT